MRGATMVLMPSKKRELRLAGRGPGLNGRGAAYHMASPRRDVWAERDAAGPGWRLVFQLEGRGRDCEGRLEPRRFALRTFPAFDGREAWQRVADGEDRAHAEFYYQGGYGALAVCGGAVCFRLTGAVRGGPEVATYSRPLHAVAPALGDALRTEGLELGPAMAQRVAEWLAQGTEPCEGLREKWAAERAAWDAMQSTLHAE